MSRIHHALTGGAAAILVLAAVLPLWLLFKVDYAPHFVSNFIIERTPPDNAIALQNALGALTMPSAILGGVMFTASVGMIAGLAYGLLVGAASWAAVLGASLVQPALMWLLFPNMTPLALAPLLFIGPVIHLMRYMPQAAHTPTRAQGISRRAALARIGIFSLGGAALSLIESIPVVVAERLSLGVGRQLFAFTPPKARVPSFDVPGLSPEVTPVEDFYKMRKFATPIPDIPADWRLTVDGLVEQPLSLSIEDILALPRTDAYMTRQCVSNPVGGTLISTALMSGLPIAALMARAGIRPDAQELVFYGRDGYSESVRLDYGLQYGLLTYAMNGMALPLVHGAPLRVEMPGLYGFKSLKWLDRIEVINTHHVAIWEQQGWVAHPVVKTMSRIDVVRTDAETDQLTIAGIAFAGLRGLSTVEVQVNGGAWLSATLNTPALAQKTWVQWRVEVPRPTGEVTVRVRAVDGEGMPQIEIEQQQFPDGASGLHQVSIQV